MQWSLASPEGVSFPFDGVPFLCVGTVNYQCHQGDDVDVKTKIKRQEERDKKEVKMEGTALTISFLSASCVMNIVRSCQLVILNELFS